MVCGVVGGVMARGDIEESVGKVPGADQGASRLAVVDATQVALALQKILRLIGTALDYGSVGHGHECSERDPADVMQNAGGIGEVFIEQTPVGGALGDEGTSD